MQLFILRQTLNGGDLRPLDLCCEDEAGVHRHPVQKDRARAALPFATPLLDALRIELISEKVDQTKARINVTGDQSLVQREAHFHLRPRFVLYLTFRVT